MSSSSLILSSDITSLLMSPSDEVFISITVFFYFYIYFWFLQFLYLCLHYPSVFQGCLFFFIRALNLIIIIIVNFQSDNSQFSAISYFVCLMCSVSSDCIFPCLLACVANFYWKLNIVYQVIGTDLNRPLAWGFINLVRSQAVCIVCCSFRCLRLPFLLGSLFLSFLFSLVFPNNSFLNKI